tara:strand:+ start:68597 stop:68935 length:339 start_codon:yes stop_codon:yes gene_type:complete
MPNQRIGSLAELRKAKTLEYFIQTESAERHIFALFHAGQIYAYENQCPHNQMPLNWNEHQFLDHGEEYLQCVNHGALFTLTEGHCVYGPCLGEKLEAVSLETVGDDLFIRLV